ncbi:MAG: cyclase family protein [Candidatus Acidiferrales bacterium]|jgi:kynurenine formamidase
MDNSKISRRSLLANAAVLAGAAVAVETTPAKAASGEQYPRNLTADDLERWSTELSNWGRWGQDDQAGTINLISPAKRKAAAALVRDGVCVSASLDADLPAEGPTSGPLPGGPRVPGQPRTTWTLTSKPPGPDPKPKPSYVTDTIATAYHGDATTHLDALSHIYYKGQIYNGFPQTSFTDRGAGKDDVMAFKDGIFTRGVLFDIPRLKNVPYLGDVEAIYPEDLEAWEKKAGFRVGSGDAMLFRTGRWLRVKEKGLLDINRQVPGLYASCLKWMRERGVAILGSDVVQDVRPSLVEGVNQPIHQLALRTMGTPLIDNCDLEALAQAAAQRRRWTFLLTVNPLRVPGATGGPVNPIAVF